MAIKTGRTVGKYVKFQLEDSGAVLRDIPVSSINGVGLTFPEVDVTAIQDAVMGMLNGQPDYVLEISGPFDTTAAQAASSGSGDPADLSGSHTVLYDLPNDLTPLAFGIYFGIRQHWSTGEPVFGLTSTTANGILCMNYNVDPVAATYTASFRMYPGSAAPAWGVAAIT
jgi:hypothetical protein